MSDCGLSGFPFLASDLADIAKWAQSIARFGWTTTVEPFDPNDDDSVESLFVTPPGGSMPSFVVWRTHAAGYMLADWQNPAHGAVDTPMATLRSALDGIIAEVAPGLAGFGP